MIQNNIYISIKEILEKHNILIDLKEYDLSFGDNKEIKWNRTDYRKLLPTDKISEYLKEKVFSLVQTENEIYYHYLPKIEYLEKILKDKEIRLNNLNKYLENGDNKEYRLFLESFGIDFPKFEKQISSIKNDIYVWCLTKKRNSKKHWEEYANNGEGVSISVEIINTNFKKGIIEIIPVCYNLDFLKELNTKLKEEYNLNIEIIGYSSFAKYFKKEEKYGWEDEVRVCFDKGMNHIHDIGMDVFKHSENDKIERQSLFTEKEDRTLNIPLKNSFFEIRIKEIFCAERHYKTIKTFPNINGIDVKKIDF